MGWWKKIKDMATNTEFILVEDFEVKTERFKDFMEHNQPYQCLS